VSEYCSINTFVDVLNRLVLHLHKIEILPNDIGIEFTSVCEKYTGQKLRVSDYNSAPAWRIREWFIFVNDAISLFVQSFEEFGNPFRRPNRENCDCLGEPPSEHRACIYFHRGATFQNGRFTADDTVD